MFELSPEQIGRHIVFYIYYQPPGNFPASQFLMEGTSKINE